MSQVQPSLWLGFVLFNAAVSSRRRAPAATWSRLYPTKAQAESLGVQLSEACRLYNAALQERIEAYARHRKSITYYDQAAQLTEIRVAESGRGWSPVCEGRREGHIATLPVRCEGAEETFGPGARLQEVWSHHHS